MRMGEGRPGRQTLIASPSGGKLPQLSGKAGSPSWRSFGRIVLLPGSDRAGDARFLYRPLACRDWIGDHSCVSQTSVPL